MKEKSKFPESLVLMLTVIEKIKEKKKVELQKLKIDFNNFSYNHVSDFSERLFKIISDDTKISKKPHQTTIQGYFTDIKHYKFEETEKKTGRTFKPALCQFCGYTDYRDFLNKHQNEFSEQTAENLLEFAGLKVDVESLLAEYKIYLNKTANNKKLQKQLNKKNIILPQNNILPDWLIAYTSNFKTSLKKLNINYAGTYWCYFHTLEKNEIQETPLLIRRNEENYYDVYLGNSNSDYSYKGGLIKINDNIISCHLISSLKNIQENMLITLSIPFSNNWSYIKGIGVALNTLQQPNANKLILTKISDKQDLQEFEKLNTTYYNVNNCPAHIDKHVFEYLRYYSQNRLDCLPQKKYDFSELIKEQEKISQLYNTININESNNIKLFENRQEVLSDTNIVDFPVFGINKSKEILKEIVNNIVGCYYSYHVSENGVINRLINKIYVKENKLTIESYSAKNIYRHGHIYFKDNVLYIIEENVGYKSVAIASFKEFNFSFFPLNVVFISPFRKNPGSSINFLVKLNTSIDEFDSLKSKLIKNKKECLTVEEKYIWDFFNVLEIKPQLSPAVNSFEDFKKLIARKKEIKIKTTDYFEINNFNQNEIPENIIKEITGCYYSYWFGDGCLNRVKTKIYYKNRNLSIESYDTSNIDRKGYIYFQKNSMYIETTSTGYNTIFIRTFKDKMDFTFFSAAVVYVFKENAEVGIIFFKKLNIPLKDYDKLTEKHIERKEECEGEEERIVWEYFYKLDVKPISAPEINNINDLRTYIDTNSEKDLIFKDNCVENFKHNKKNIHNATFSNLTINSNKKISIYQDDKQQLSTKIIDIFTGCYFVYYPTDKAKLYKTKAKIYQQSEALLFLGEPYISPILNGFVHINNNAFYIDIESAGYKTQVIGWVRYIEDLKVIIATSNFVSGYNKNPTSSINLFIKQTSEISEFVNLKSKIISNFKDITNREEQIAWNYYNKLNKKLLIAEKIYSLDELENYINNKTIAQKNDIEKIILQNHDEFHFYKYFKNEIPKNIIDALIGCYYSYYLSHNGVINKVTLKIYKEGKNIKLISHSYSNISRIGYVYFKDNSMYIEVDNTGYKTLFLRVFGEPDFSFFAISVIYVSSINNNAEAGINIFLKTNIPINNYNKLKCKQIKIKSECENDAEEVIWEYFKEFNTKPLKAPSIYNVNDLRKYIKENKKNKYEDYEIFDNFSSYYKKMSDIIDDSIKTRDKTEVRILTMVGVLSWYHLEEVAQKKNIKIEFALPNPELESLKKFNSHLSPKLKNIINTIHNFKKKKEKELKERNVEINIYFHSFIPQNVGILINNEHLLSLSHIPNSEKQIETENYIENSIYYSKKNKLGAIQIDQFKNWFEYIKQDNNKN